MGQLKSEALIYTDIRHALPVGSDFQAFHMIGRSEFFHLVHQAFPDPLASELFIDTEFLHFRYGAAMMQQVLQMKAYKAYYPAPCCSDAVKAGAVPEIVPEDPLKFFPFQGSVFKRAYQPVNMWQVTRCCFPGYYVVAGPVV